MKNILAILSVVVMAASATAQAACPTDALQGFNGTFKGVLAPLSFQGEPLAIQNVVETHAVTGCNSFDFDVHYSNPETGLELREVKFSAVWDDGQGVFNLAGEVIHGSMRVLRNGHFVVSFETAFAGIPAHCEEMITVTNDNTQVMRSVQCAAGGIGGTSLGVRNALVSRIP